MDEKVAFLKKLLIAEITDVAFTESDSLGVLTRQIQVRFEDCDGFADIYFEMLMAIIR
ncbi:hypothetical protein [Pleurocapsa sp. FMAR1]|uniref:hypothetical protein n=1 Tax=Pleurocapsa sp. FMAR1 TaxID=3040204 RepID=UPI0029C98887|nr:hypothetical protein [Pleurocapsa sp. FMAR1]